jgi:hypothetical protein
MTRFVCDKGIWFLTDIYFWVLKILLYKLGVYLVFFAVYLKLFLPKIATVFLINWPDSGFFSSQLCSLD